MCLLKALNWRNLAHQHRQKQQQHHKHVHVMLCFTTFFLMKSNKMLSQLLHTANTSLRCWSNAILCLLCYIEYGKTQMVVLSTTDVQLHYTWFKCCHKLMSTVELPGAKFSDTHMGIYTGILASDVSLTREFQKYLSIAACKHGSIYQRT